MTALAFQDSRTFRAATDQLRQVAYKLINQKSFIRKPVKLSSGKDSNHYFDMKFTMLDPIGASVLAQLVFDKLPEEKVDFIGGLELGAVPLIGPVVMLSAQKNRPIPGLIVRKAAKLHGSQRLVEGAESLEGKRVMIVDDVTTTGESAMKSIRALKAEGATIVMVVSILDREEGASELYLREGLRFEPIFKASEFLDQ